MKEKQVIEHLRLLQSVQPNTKTLRLIRKQIVAPVDTRKTLNLRKWLSLTPIFPLIAFAAIAIFFLVMISFFPNIFTNILVTTKIALAPNHYEKAKIALINVQNHIASLHGNVSDTNKIKQFSQSLALANTEMSGLQLVGEKGKYTSYQCDELYESYHKDLKQTENTMDSDNSNAGKSLILQVEQYDKLAQTKLQNYSKKSWEDK